MTAPPPVAAAVSVVPVEPVPEAQIFCVVVGVILTAVNSGFTTTVTSFEITAEPQVGVDVHTMIQVPVPKIAPVGVKVLPV